MFVVLYGAIVCAILIAARFALRAPILHIWLKFTPEQRQWIRDFDPDDQIVEDEAA